MRRVLLIYVLIASFVCRAQVECSGGRYTDYDLFPAFTVTHAVAYGSNTGVAGGMQTLRMDIYEPTGDTLPLRPVILVGFGGSFVSGSRADVAGLCQILARLGYVAIAPDYRVGFFWPNIETTTKAVMRAAHDFRGCVRYLRKTVAEEANPYRIDQDRIIAGGVSAGGIGAIHAAYLDQQSEIPAALYADSAALGSIEGNSGSPGYSSDVLAVYSLSGAIGDTSWIQAGDQPLCSLHESGDQIVPCWTEEVEVIGLPTGLIANGSGHIHQRMDHVGVDNCFLLYPGGGHVGYLDYDPVASIDLVVQFCANVVCGLEANCGTLYAGIAGPPAGGELTVFPNPTEGMAYVDLDEPADIRVLNVNGEEMLSLRSASGRTAIDLTALPAGLYIVRTSALTPRLARVVKL